jgi:hypothetical protein
LRVVAAAEQHWAAADIWRARSLLEDVLPALPGGPIRGRALKQLARIRTDDFEVSAALFEEALIEAGDDHRVAAQIESLLAEVWVNRGDQDKAVSHANAAVERAERTEDRGLLAGMLGAYGMAKFCRGDGIQRELLARGIALEEQADDVSSSYLPSAELAYSLY